MALEIERRYLVRGSGWRSRVNWQAHLRQGYLRSDHDGFTLRVRLTSAEAPAAETAAGPSDKRQPGEAPRPEGLGESATGSAQAYLTLKAALPAGAAPANPQPDPIASNPAADNIESASAEARLQPPRPALTRLEFEYAIPLTDGEQLLAMAGSRLEKRRYGLDLGEGLWVVDVFEAENAPLVVAEVELPHANAPFRLPDWCGTELTGWHQLSNAALAQHPLNSWPSAEREALLAGSPVWPGPPQD